jgi:hypothetical protein
MRQLFTGLFFFVIGLNVTLSAPRNIFTNDIHASYLFISYTFIFIGLFLILMKDK